MLKIKKDQDSPWKKLSNADRYVDSWKFNRAFLNAMEETMISANIKDVGRLRKHKFCFDRSNKIPRLRAKWNGKYFKTLKITVDLVPAVTIERKLRYLKGIFAGNTTDKTLYVIPKGHHPNDEISLPVSFNHIETSTICSLPDEINKAYKLCKALRLPVICCKGIVGQLHLIESVYTEDFIKSYMLKNCIFVLLRSQTFRVTESASGHSFAYIRWAEMIYELFRKCLENGSMRPYYTDEAAISLNECKHKRTDAYATKRWCCQQRDATQAMVENILQFIRSDPHHNPGDVQIEPKSRRERFAESLSCLAIHRMSVIKTKRFESYTFLPFSTQEPISVDVTGEDSEFRLPKDQSSEDHRHKDTQNENANNYSREDVLNSLRTSERKRHGTRCNWAIFVFLIVVFIGSVYILIYYR